MRRLLSRWSAACLDLAVWLNRWASVLGKYPRGAITRQQVIDQLRTWRQTYSGSARKHAKQALLTLWRELDGLSALPPDYQDVILFASLSGWRKSEGN